MNAPIENLVERLQAKRSGSGWIAKCPAHNDRTPSLSINEGTDGRVLIKCHAGCCLENILTATGLTKADLFPERPSARPKRRSSLVVNPGCAVARAKNNEKADPIVSSQKTRTTLLASAPEQGAPVSRHSEKSVIDWDACNDAFTDKHVEGLAKWRGYSIELCQWLRANKLVGVFNRHIAFPVTENGRVIGVHYKVDGGWRYTPVGVKTTPFVIGELVAGEPVHCFESQWCGFGFMDVSGERSGIVITRGASNGGLVAGLIPENSTVYVWTQNDAAGEKWQNAICANTKATVKQAKIPASHKDLNDWIRAGATADDLLAATISARNSLNSHLLSFELQEDYPSPLDAAAFHGLAGEIVRRIEPHTEADPAALLFQFLAAFGNIIGRTAYTVADGAWHYLNLFGVLVGESSKGRKGTSWHQIVYVLQHVDEEWRNNIANGLSSGEGLIWAVRDPITETKSIKEKGRHTGEYETVMTDHGIADKRLFVVESEFANVLKVMAREGNTLSPVIRAAWESGRLRTMVKNSPACATDAHISIIGHITRAELRRLLTQTESANGFGNRFNWLAVKRSKCLPEGGKIEQVNFNDLVVRLHSAIEFARETGQLRRSEEARELWRADYPMLSEGKPGMLGAVTGRAEAQVMRLSALYALLDCSRLIHPEHHHPAMALWSYSEQSAQWIFGTKTGDRNADKVLTALRHAPNGMTKTEISGEVFNRHAPSIEIDEALRLLHGLKMVNYKIQSTAGASTQRWFFTAEDREKSE